MGFRLFVGNLPYDTTEDEIRNHFSPVGQLSYVSIPLDRETGKKRGFAFVEFAEASQAEAAIRQFNNQPFKDRKSTRLNSSHTVISYAVFCLKKKNNTTNTNNSKS